MKNTLDNVSVIFYTMANICDTKSEIPVMSIRERSAWISLLLTSAIWGAYFWKIWPDLIDDGALAASTTGVFVSAVVVLVIVQIVLAILLAIAAAVLRRRSEEPPMDERDQLIDLKAIRVAFYAMSALLIAVSGLWIFGMSPLVMANGILASMVIAEILRAASVVLSYRLGA
ncbi:MAG TPA: hypothetical protein PLF78_12000 [Caulobacter sp.]|nr:hypothetical protein [Caulobacter sp.]